MRLGAAAGSGQAWTALALAAVLWACSPKPPPRTPADATRPSPPPAETPPAPAVLEPPPAAEAAAEPQTVPDPEDRPRTVVIEPGGEETVTQDRDLVRAAAVERRRRIEAGPPVAVIDDRSLADYAGVEITAADPEAGADRDADAAETVDTDRDEAYWRSRARDVRQRWHDAVEEIPRLEARVAELRRRFYAEDDPFYRDSQIKPAWDLALEEIDRAHERAQSARRELAELLEEGRQAGALPGWLREGIELEPEGFGEEGEEGGLPGIYEPEDPVVVEEDEGDGG